MILAVAFVSYKMPLELVLRAIDCMNMSEMKEFSVRYIFGDDYCFIFSRRPNARLFCA